MNSLQEILKRAQKVLFCPVCKRNFALNEIKLRGAFDHTYIFQTVCLRHQPPVITVFVAHYQTTPQQKLEIIEEIQKKEKALTADELIDLHEALKNFNGDFINLWENNTQIHR